MEEILARAKKVAEAAEVFTASVEETSVQFETNRLKHIHNKQSTIVALRIIKQGKIGYATTTELAGRQNLVDMAVETARFGMPARFEFPSLTPYPPVEILDNNVNAVSIGQMAKLGEDLISRVRKHTPDLDCEAMVNRGLMSVRIVNSRGGQARYQQSVFSFGVEGQLISEADMLFVGDSQSSCHPILEPDAVAELVLRQLERAKTRASIPSGTMPVVFTPDGVAGALVPSLMAAFNGKVVLEGASPLTGKLGQTVFDKRFSLWDDPTVAYRPSSRPCDDEGVPSQRTPLIAGGAIAGFLYDLQTAARAGAKSTGNGSRGRGGLPSPSPSGLVIAPGKVTFDEMIADIKEGLVVEQLMGASQGNVLGGDFSGNVLLGYRVENGKIVGRVKDTMVSGNIYQLLKQIAAIGSDARWVSGFLQTPSIYFHNVSVASK